MEKIIIPLAVIAGLLLVIVGVGVLIKVRLSHFSRQAFGTSDIIKGYNEQKKKLSETPRSVHSLTGIYLPEILRDFPEFDAEHYRMGAQAVVRAYLNAIAAGSTATGCNWNALPNTACKSMAWPRSPRGHRPRARYAPQVSRKGARADRTMRRRLS